MANIFAVALLSGTLACGSALAQDAAPAATQPSAAGDQAQAGAGKITSGSVIPVELTKTVDAKKAKTGDEVVAKVTQDIKTASGEVFVARNTKVVGHVTEARARSKEQRESEIGIAFDHAITKNGDMKLPMSIQAIIGPAPSRPSGGGYDPPGPATGGGTTTSPMAGRAPLSPGSQPEPLPTVGTDAQSRSPITGKTKGVIGLPDLTLEANAQNAGLGSVVSSQKSNVKLESGTLLLLRVN